MPTLSLCIITKNEEQYLEECLNSVKEIVDEIIIVDTGSTDKTLGIAKKFNAKIINIPWQNDFSKARNESLRYATKDWILVLDADETISKQDTKEIKELIKTNEYLGFMLIQRSYTNDSASIKWVSSKDDSYEESKPYSGWVYSGITRLFKNYSKIRFEYPVHETVKESIKRIGGKIKTTDIPIHHYGKLKENIDEKSRLYLEIGKEKLKQNPKAKFYYELGIQSMVLNKFEESIENLKKAIELNKEWSAPYISLGNIYCKQKDYQQAIDLLERALKIKPGDSNIHNNLGVAYEKLGNPKIALEHYKSSIKINSHNADAYQNLARLMMRFNKIDDVIKILERLCKLKPNDIASYNNLAGVYFQKRMFSEAIEVLNKALELNPKNLITLSNLASIQISQKRYKEALELLNKALEIEPENKEFIKMIEKINLNLKDSKNHTSS